MEKLNIPFIVASPDIDETAISNETPQQLVERLSIQKAKALEDEFEDALIIGSDQIAVLNGEIIGKPENYADAVKQLSESSGSTLKLFAGVSVVNSYTNTFQFEIDTFSVEFKNLTLIQIKKYLEMEKPYDCCGSLKAEGPGITLLKRLRGDDPNTLLGMPLIKLVGMLENEGVQVI